MAEVGSTSSSPGVSLHDWLEEESEESLNDDEIDEFVRINRAKNTVKKRFAKVEGLVHYYWRKARHFGHPHKRTEQASLSFFCKGYQSLWKGVRTRYTDLFEEHRLISTRKWADREYYHGQ